MALSCAAATHIKRRFHHRRHTRLETDTAAVAVVETARDALARHVRRTTPTPFISTLRWLHAGMGSLFSFSRALSPEAMGHRKPSRCQRPILPYRTSGPLDRPGHQRRPCRDAPESIRLSTSWTNRPRCHDPSTPFDALLALCPRDDRRSQHLPADAPRASTRRA